MLKQLLVCSLSALLLAGCTAEETGPKKVIKPTELPLTLKFVESKEPEDAFVNSATYVMTGQTDRPLYLTGIEYFASGKQKIWFSETIKPGQYDLKSLKLSQQSDRAKGYRSYRYELEDTMNEWSEESNDLKKFLMTGVEFQNQSFHASEYDLLMLEKSTVHESMMGRSLAAIDSPAGIKLKKGEHAFTISLSTKSFGTPSARTL